MLVLYQNTIVIPALKQVAEPQLIASAALHPSARGDQDTQQVTEVPRDSKVFNISVDVNVPSPPEAYQCEVVRASGGRVLEFEGKAHGSSLNVLLPADLFPDGDYILILRAANGPQTQEIDRFPFKVRRLP